MAAKKYGNSSVVIWEDRKRWCGLPWTFTKYSLIETDEWVKLFIRTGFLTNHEEEVNLYRIFDISLSVTLTNKIFGVGTITVYSKDESLPTLCIRNIKEPYKVRNMLASKIEQEKAKRGFRIAEFN